MHCGEKYFLWPALNLGPCSRVYRFILRIVFCSLLFTKFKSSEHCRIDPRVVVGFFGSIREASGGFGVLSKSYSFLSSSCTNFLLFLITLPTHPWACLAILPRLEECKDKNAVARQL